MKQLFLLSPMLLLCFGCGGGSSPESTDVASGEMIYLCKETKQLVKAAPQEIPGINPSTGRATLYRALYCSACKRWYAVPPPDAYPGNPLTYPCPKHRQPMSVSGPLESKQGQ